MRAIMFVLLALIPVATVLELIKPHKKTREQEYAEQRQQIAMRMEEFGVNDGAPPSDDWEQIYVFTPKQLGLSPEDKGGAWDAR